ncbi:MAG: lysophospholipase [Chloroflexota bacterium]|nr:MAG: lysophospholipase [Chloroflexota bacterium]
MKKKALVLVVPVIAGVIILFLVGPRATIDLSLKPIELPEDLDHYLAESEAHFSDIIPETEKTIIWANAAKTKTPLAVIYLHGYSATRQEAAPLCDQIVAHLGANLYYARLTGHGRSGQALAEATVNDWLNDTIEAVEIGKRLGDKVIVIGSSTGGTLATWHALQANNDEVLAYVLMSPNFGTKDLSGEILTWPWAEYFVPLVAGAEYEWKPLNPKHTYYWTEKYPAKALIPMMALVKFVRESKLESIEKPLLVIYSPNDQVINPRAVELAYARFGSAVKKMVARPESENPEHHVLAGDILARGDTGDIADIILEFIGQVQ